MLFEDLRVVFGRFLGEFEHEFASAWCLYFRFGDGLEGLSESVSISCGKFEEGGVRFC